MKGKQKKELETFNCLYKEIDELYHGIALKSGLSDSAFSVFYALMELGDGCLQTEIAERNSMSKQTIHSSVKRLEKSGYILLRPGKGRDMHIHLTEKGRMLAEERILPVFKVENSIFEEMSQEERKQMLDLMRKYVELFREKALQLLV